MDDIFQGFGGPAADEELKALNATIEAMQREVLNKVPHRMKAIELECLGVIPKDTARVISEDPTFQKLLQAQAAISSSMGQVMMARLMDAMLAFTMGTRTRESVEAEVLEMMTNLINQTAEATKTNAEQLRAFLDGWAPPEA